MNTITLLLPNNTLYEVGNITTIPDNYFQINYTKCITGKNFPNEFELTIITRTISRIIDLSYFYLSYQKDTNNTNVEIIENKFPNNKIFIIPYEPNNSCIIKIYEKYYDNYANI